MRNTESTSFFYSKKGGYAVEAAVVIPIFIAAVLALISIIPVFRTADNYTFTVCDEMRLESVKSAFRSNSVSLPLIVKGRMNRENTSSRAKITYYRYLYTKNNIDDLITLRIESEISGANPLGLFDGVRFKGQVTARAFTGALVKEPPAINQNDTDVFIFPENGKRYHNAACSYVEAACEMCYLSQEIKRKYRSCKKCNADSAQIGTVVYLFKKSGKAYHDSHCKTVERYYIKIKKSEAVKLGYSPCSKCGGE